MPSIFKQIRKVINKGISKSIVQLLEFSLSKEDYQYIITISSIKEELRVSLLLDN